MTQKHPGPMTHKAPIVSFTKYRRSPVPHRSLLRAIVLATLGCLTLTATPPSPLPPNPSASSTTDGSPAETWLDNFLVRISPRLREFDRRESEIRQQLSVLPRPASGPTSEHVGFHSSIFTSSNTPTWVQVDLGSPLEFDRILLVAAHLGHGESKTSGYCFPIRFRVESSNDSSFTHPHLLADYSRDPFPNPGDEPVFVASDGRPARYIRVTALQLAPRGRNYAFALGELIVLRGHRNLAAGRLVESNSPLDTPRPWDRRHLVDNQSILGLPVSSVRSPMNGYHSVEFEKRPDAHKWVSVDLGRDITFDDIRLIPARPLDWADRLGFGFPVRFRIDTREDRPEASWSTLVDHTEADYPNPGDNPAVFQSDGRTARWIRILATRLWERREDYAFALSELEVWAGDTNVALNAEVDALESHERNDWSTRALVDGYSSQWLLLPLGTWADGLHLRQQSLLELRELEIGRSEHLGHLTRRLILGAGYGSIAIALASVLLLHRARARRQQELESVRRQIARDMHDDLGARLTELTYLSELARQFSGQPDRCADLNRQISDRARDVVGSLDDLVWTVNPRNDSLPRLVAFLLRQAERLLDPTPILCRIDAPTNVPEIPVSSQFRHHSLLLLKESVNNAIRHAAPTEITIRLLADNRYFTIAIEDDGQGMPTRSPSDLEAVPGNGLENMQQRVHALKGLLRIEPRTPHGTCIHIRLPIDNRGHSPFTYIPPGS
jgi:signal transduction histidine kinase